MSEQNHLPAEWHAFDDEVHAAKQRVLWEQTLSPAENMALHDAAYNVTSVLMDVADLQSRLLDATLAETAGQLKISRSALGKRLAKHELTVTACRQSEDVGELIEASPEFQRNASVIIALMEEYRRRTSGS